MVGDGRPPMQYFYWASEMKFLCKEIQDSIDLHYISISGDIPKFIKDGAANGDANCNQGTNQSNRRDFHLIDNIRDDKLDKLWSNFKENTQSTKTITKFPLPFHSQLGFF